MKVRELIEKLQEMDQEAHVMLFDPPDHASNDWDEAWYATEVSLFGDEARIG